jgi:hypothetical protein
MLNGLALYWAVNGTATWHLETLPGWFGGTPAITTDPGRVHVDVIGAFGGIADEATSNGTGTWQLTTVTGGLFESDPAVTANDGIENVAAIGGDGNLLLGGPGRRVLRPGASGYVRQPVTRPPAIPPGAG